MAQRYYWWVCKKIWGNGQEKSNEVQQVSVLVEIVREVEEETTEWEGFTLSYWKAGKRLE